MKTGNVKNWQCLVCGHVAEGDTPPDVCPVCGVGPDQFEEIAVSNTGFMSEKEESTKNYKPQRTTYTRTHYREKMEGFVAADDEPIPAEQETFNLDRFKVRVLEIFQEVAAQNEAPANVRLAFIDAIINTYV